MTYWVFHAQQLEKALGEHVAQRQAEGASEQQAKDEASAIQQFLVRAKSLIGGKG